MFDEMINKIREKIVVTRIARVKGPVGAYVHHDHQDGRAVPGVGRQEDKPVLKDVAMHIVAMKPVVSYPEELDPVIVEKERERLRDQAKKSGKPDNIIDKIVEGQLKTFYNDAGVLTFQPFAKDQSKTREPGAGRAGAQSREVHTMGDRPPLVHDATGAFRRAGRTRDGRVAFRHSG